MLYQTKREKSEREERVAECRRLDVVCRGRTSSGATRALNQCKKQYCPTIKNLTRPSSCPRDTAAKREMRSVISSWRGTTASGLDSRRAHVFAAPRAAAQFACTMEKGARPQRDRKRKSYADIADGDGDAGGLPRSRREALGGGPKRGPGRPPGVRNGDGSRGAGRRASGPRTARGRPPPPGGRRRARCTRSRCGARRRSRGSGASSTCCRRASRTTRCTTAARSPPSTSAASATRCCGAAARSRWT